MYINYIYLYINVVIRRMGAIARVTRKQSGSFLSESIEQLHSTFVDALNICLHPTNGLNI